MIRRRASCGKVMYSFPETLLHLQRPDKKPVLSCCPDLDLATGAAKHDWPGALQGAAGQVLSCCPLEHLQTTTSPLPLLSVKICLPNRSRHTIALHVCIFFTGQRYAILGSKRDSMCFTWQSTVNGHGVGVCVGVVELPAGPGPSTETFYTQALHSWV